MTPSASRTAPAIRLEFAREKDGTVVARYHRPDGSAAWERHRGTRAAFFPVHDFLHVAVETVLGARHGFFGLLADGWELADMDGKGPRGPLPDEALQIERLVSLLQAELSGEPQSAAQLNGQMPGFGPLTDQQAAAIRDHFAALRHRWRQVPPGETLHLAIPLPAPFTP